MTHLSDPSVNNSLHLANAPVNNSLHLGVTNLIHLTSSPVNNSLHLSVANLTHLANAPVNSPLHLGVANLTHLANAPVNNSLHLSVANLTHLSLSPVNNPLHLRCRKSDTPLRPIWPAASGMLSAHSRRNSRFKRASGGVPYNVSAAQNTERNKALSTLLWAKESPLPSPKFRLGADKLQAVQPRWT